MTIDGAEDPRRRLSNSAASMTAIIDLRSDAITTPTAEMWQAMREAELGWASAGEDDAVDRLEETGARLSGKEAALFVLTGSMANLAALLGHSSRGDQVLVESSSHILWCEEWGLTYVAGLLPRPLTGDRGKLDPAQVVEAVLESKYRHRPRTSLLALENTDNVFGAAVPASLIAELGAVARDLGVRVHLDGARVLNACVALDVSLAEMLAGVDSAMISLNKGLCAPGGALLVGTSDFVASSRQNLRRLGGGSHHQAGIFAAAGLVALETMLGQLRADNGRAKELAALLAPLPGLAVDPARVDTNIVVVELDPWLGNADDFVCDLIPYGVRGYVSGPSSLRFVTHHPITDEDITHASDAVIRLIESRSLDTTGEPLDARSSSRRR